MDLGDGHGEGEDEIVQGSSSDVSEGDGRGRYESVANREKRKRAESLGTLELLSYPGSSKGLADRTVADAMLRGV